MPHRRPFKLAKRRQFLAIAASLNVVLGVSYLLDTSEQRVAAFGWLPAIMGTQTLGAVWLAAAGLAFLVATFRPSLPKRLEGWAFGLLILPAIYSASIWLASWVNGLSATGYVSAARDAFVAAAVLLIASWGEDSADARDRA